MSTTRRAPLGARLPSDFADELRALDARGAEHVAPLLLACLDAGWTLTALSRALHFTPAGIQTRAKKARLAGVLPADGSLVPPLPERGPKVRKYWGWRATATQTICHRLYVLEYATGVVKIGQSKDVALRFDDYRRRDRKSFESIIRIWVSKGHGNAYSTEVELIRFCASQWENLPGTREYFVGADFDLILAYIDGLKFDRCSPDEMTAEERRTLHAVDERCERFGYVEYDVARRSA